MSEIVTTKELAKYLRLHEGSQRRKFMKQLKRDLQAVSKSLKQLTLKTENIAKRLDKFEKAKTKPKVTKKSVKISTAATVLAIIKRSRKGVDVATLKSKAGIGSRTINNIILQAKEKGQNQEQRKGYLCESIAS